MSCSRFSFATALLFAGSFCTVRAEENANPQPDRAGLFKQIDANSDGQVAAEEVPEDKRRLFGRLVSKGDANGDGKLSLEEFTKALQDERPEVPPGQAGEDQFRRFLESDPRDVFNGLDTNKDGKIELSEVPEQARGRLQQFMDNYDSNRDKALSLEEFRKGHEMIRTQLGLVKPQPTPQNPPMPGGLLRILDTDGDGMLSKEEIAAAPESLRKLDRDNDGAISGRELAAVFGGPPGQPGTPQVRRPNDPNRRPEAGAFLERLRSMDQNGDGKWSEDELPPFLRQQFSTIDANGDKVVDADELRQALPKLRRPQN